MLSRWVSTDNSPTNTRKPRNGAIVFTHGRIPCVVRPPCRAYWLVAGRTMRRGRDPRPDRDADPFIDGFPNR